MVTPRQIEANRLNSQRSTGPRTPQGRAVSSQNALKSGLDAESQFVYGEDRDEFATLQREYFDCYQPRTPGERFQVETLIRNEWTLRRLFRAEAHLWEHQVIRADRSEGTPLGAALMSADQVFRRLQCARTPQAVPELAPQPQPATDDSPELASFLPVAESLPPSTSKAVPEDCPPIKT